MVMNKNFDSSRRRSFISYCQENKKLRERDFKSELYINGEYYHYYPPYGSHGHFIIQIDILDFEYNKMIFTFGFQYQNDSCKLNMLRPGLYYKDSEVKEIADLVPLFIQDKYVYERFNRPKTKAYYSMSKKDYSLSKLSDEEFSKKLFLEFKEAINTIEKMKPRFENFGCRFFG